MVALIFRILVANFVDVHFQVAAATEDLFLGKPLQKEADMPGSPIDRGPAFTSSAVADSPGPQPDPIYLPEIHEPIARRDTTMLSIARVAELFGRSPRTVRWWIATDRLPVVRIGRTPFVPVEALDRMVEAALDDDASEIN